MRLKVIYTFLLCLFWIANLAAQLPHDFRSEQIFLGVAKTEWAPNDTIEANGIVTCLASGNIRPYSRYLYIELLDSSDSVMVRQKVGCDENGRFRARIPTVSVAGVGVYYVRAYTNLMRNFSGENFALQPVLIGKAFPKREKGNGVLKCSIYPEGGFLVENQVQGIVASVTDYSGRAISGVKLSVVNDKGDTLCVGKTRPSGIVPLGNRLGVTTVFLTDSVGNVLSESSLTSKYRMTELPSLPDTIAADSIDAWRGQVEGSLERHFLYSVWAIGGKGESQGDSHSGQIPTAYGCGVANRHNLIRARYRGQRMRENKKTL